MNDTCRTMTINGVEIQENGIIRNCEGRLIGRLSEDINFYSEDLSPEPEQEPDSFQDAVADVLNRRSAENDSNTPDYVLAQYLLSCLNAFNTATQQRETWYGRDARPTYTTK